MALSEARKRANAKWDKENMATLSCRVKIDTAQAFKQLCELRGSTVSKEITAFIRRELDGHPVGDYAERGGAGDASE